MGGEKQENQWALLLRAANRGDGGAYRRLLLELAPVLRAFARRGLAGAGMADTDAEDIVQETLLAIHLKRQSWDEDAPAGPWLRAIARHKMIDLLRRRGRRIVLPIEDFSSVLAANDSEPSFLAADIDRQLDSLPAGQRNAVRAIAVDGASIGEAAARLSMTKGAVRVALHRGLGALAAKLNAEKK
ncbi:MAG: sigma-70 family RNA polymerase sigma factor [Beijerinckiaceae bacterium]|nr:sigma-70 family RNA polymerase sigma factor [Beijerinckiaceae bacterium]